MKTTQTFKKHKIVACCSCQENCVKHKLGIWSIFVPLYIFVLFHWWGLSVFIYFFFLFLHFFLSFFFFLRWICKHFVKMYILGMLFFYAIGMLFNALFKLSLLYFFNWLDVVAQQTMFEVINTDWTHLCVCGFFFGFFFSPSCYLTTLNNRTHSSQEAFRCVL